MWIVGYKCHYKIDDMLNENSEIMYWINIIVSQKLYIFDKFMTTTMQRTNFQLVIKMENEVWL